MHTYMLDLVSNTDCFFQIFQSHTELSVLSAWRVEFANIANKVAKLKKQ